MSVHKAGTQEVIQEGTLERDNRRGTRGDTVGGHMKWYMRDT